MNLWDVKAPLVGKVIQGNRKPAPNIIILLFVWSSVLYHTNSVTVVIGLICLLLSRVVKGSLASISRNFATLSSRVYHHLIPRVYLSGCGRNTCAEFVNEIYSGDRPLVSLVVTLSYRESAEDGETDRKRNSKIMKSLVGS